MVAPPSYFERTVIIETRYVSENRIAFGFFTIFRLPVYTSRKTEITQSLDEYHLGFISRLHEIYPQDDFHPAQLVSVCHSNQETNFKIDECRKLYHYIPQINFY